MATLAQLQAASTYDDLAALFRIPVGSWKTALYGSTSTYSTFSISKRSGGARTIESPLGIRREIQTIFLDALKEGYKQPSGVHGFVAGRSIVSNASKHLSRRSIVNLDLLDFFNSISFKRVRGIFLAQPFHLHWVVANILAHACCSNGRLPMGGITSPIISNLASVRLDKRLSGLAARYGGEYSRYADDITFSFDRNLTELPGIVARDTAGKPILGGQVADIVNAEGFAPNVAKFHVAERASRKIVTGIVVNERLNVRRKWLRSLESVIYAIHKFGSHVVAAGEYPRLPPDIANRILLRKVHGRLAFLLMVRGRGDWITSDLAHKFNQACVDPRLKVPDTEIVSKLYRASRAVVVVTSSSVPVPVDEWDSQGSGFIRSDGVIVTAAHAIQGGAGAVFPFVCVRHHLAPGVLHRCEILHVDTDRDLAFLRLTAASPAFLRSRFKVGLTPEVGKSITSIGFPNYHFGDNASQQPHHVTGVRRVNGVMKIVVNGHIAGGLSGGPVLDEKNVVTGVVHRSAAGGGHANEFVSALEISASFALI